MTGHGFRLGLNQATLETTRTTTMVELCCAAEIQAVTLWRHQYVESDPSVTRMVCDDAGVTVTSVCRGGFLSGTRPVAEALADNRAAIDEAVVLGAGTVVLVCGPVVDGDAGASRQRIAEAIAELLPYARQAGVRLAVEPFHPMFLAERSAIVTLDQAADLCAAISDPHLAVAVDTYHVWWDPRLAPALRRVAGRIAVVHVADWLVPTTNLLAGRGLPGDGVIDLAAILRLVTDVGFDGVVEVEALNPDIWDRPPGAVIRDVVDRMHPLLASTTSPDMRYERNPS